MEMEFYYLCNTLNSYKRSIVQNLEKVDKNVSEAIEEFETNLGPDMYTKKYTLSQEMLKILEFYVKILFLTEKVVQNFRKERSSHHDDGASNISEFRVNPFVLSVFKTELDNTVVDNCTLSTEIKPEMEQNADDASSEVSSVCTSVSTETLVNMTNNLIEEQRQNREMKREVEDKIEVKVEQTKNTDSGKKGTARLIQNFPSTSSVKFPINYRPIVKTSNKTAITAKSNNVNKKISVRLPSPTKSLDEKSKITSFPSKSHQDDKKPKTITENNSLEPPIIKNISNSELSPTAKPPKQSETESPPTKQSPPITPPNIFTATPKTENKPAVKTSPPEVKPSTTKNIPTPPVKSPPITPLNEPNVFNATPKIENKPAMKTPPQDVKPSNHLKSEPEASTVQCHESKNPFTSTPVKIENKSAMKAPQSEVKPSPIKNVSFVESTVTISPPNQTKSEPVTPSNPSRSPIKRPNSNPFTPSTEDTAPESNYTAITKLLKMTVHDRRKEAEKRYEGHHVIEEFKWKAIPKTPSCVERKKEKSPVYEIPDDTVRVNEYVTFSCVNTPTDFYVRPNQELFQLLENSLNDDLNNTYQYVVANYQSKSEAKAVLGNFAFVFLSDKHRWFRVEVIDWMEDELERVKVRLIDYGDDYFCRYKNLKAMMELYTEFPKMAVKCHFAGIYSPTAENKSVWPVESIDVLRKLCEMEKKTQFLVIYAKKVGDSYAVDLTKGDSEDTLAQILVRQRLAMEEAHLVLTAISEEDSDDLIEFDGINEAITGYDAKDEARICRFTDSSGRCFKGPRCKLEHKKLREDGITTDQILSANQPMETLPLPAKGEKITILITGYINTCHFYAQIIRNRSKSDLFNDEFQTLKDNMNANNIVQTYEMFKLYPAEGEVILVKHNNEWHRAMCLGDMSSDGVNVFLADFGTNVFKKLKDMRQMKDDFLYLPFQAVECELDSCCEISNATPEMSWGFFQNCMQFQNFTAYVVENTLPLQLKLWDANDLEMDYVLKQYGLGQDRNANVLLEDANILTVG